MDELLQIKHSHATQKNGFIKQWSFNKDKIIMSLIYNQFNIILKNKTICNSDFYLKKLDDNSLTRIYNIQDFLLQNKIHIETSGINYQKCIELIEYTNNCIGNYTFESPYDIGWYIPHFLKLSIHFYEYSNEPYILLNYKNKDVILSEKKLKVFLEKNKKVILKMQEKIINEHILKNTTRNKQSNQQLNQSSNKQLNQSSNKQSKHANYNFYIKKDLKTRYLVQACKPLPETYPWLI